MQVELISHTPDPQLAVVNAARVSFAKESASFSEKDAKLLRYLWEHKHTSPFRHAHFTFRIKAPIFVMRQIAKHVVGVSVNEISGRYVTFEETECWFPNMWRGAPTNGAKQGSAGPIESDLCQDAGDCAYMEAVALCAKAYRKLLELGVCKEQARAVLPLATYTEVIWTGSLQACLHFLELRLDSHAQAETREVAQMMLDALKPIVPDVMTIVGL